MLSKIFIYSFQISLLITEAALNLPQTESPVPILNTETIILSLGDPDDARNDDLEIIKSPSGKSPLEKKLLKFHRYVNAVEMTEGPKEKLLYDPMNKYKNHKQFLSASYPNHTPAEESEDEKPLKDTARKKKKRKKKKMRTIRYRQLQGNPRTIRKRQVTRRRKKKRKKCNYLEKEYLDFVNQRMRDDTAFKYSDEVLQKRYSLTHNPNIKQTISMFQKLTTATHNWLTKSNSNLLYLQLTGKPEETVKEVIYKIVDVRTPKNCTQYSGVGVQAIECIVEKYKNGEVQQIQMIYAISLIVLVWFGVYLATVLPLWCLKGWCCCCCSCEFCLPKKNVREIEKYLAKNPPGVITTSDGAEKCHNPTQNEIELYEQLRRLISEF